MNSLPPFNELLIARRMNIEEQFDDPMNAVGLRSYIPHLEILFDLAAQECVSERIPPKSRPEKLAFLSLTIQALWGAMNLVRIGLYSAARSLLRCALENELRWEYPLAHAGARCSPDEPWRTDSDEAEPWELRENEKDLWFREGLAVLYDYLTGDVHLNIGTLSNPQGLGPSGYSRLSSAIHVSSDPSDDKLNLFGRSYPDVQEDMFVTWLRICTRFVWRTAKGEPIHKLNTDELYSATPATAIALDGDKLAATMWAEKKIVQGKEYPEIVMNMLNLETGQMEVRRFPEEEGISLPICERDPMICGFVRSRRIPIPTCTLRMKRSILYPFAELKMGKQAFKDFKKKEYRKFPRTGDDSDRNREEQHKRVLTVLDEHVQKAYGRAWQPYRNRLLLEWLSHFGVRSCS